MAPGVPTTPSRPLPAIPVSSRLSRLPVLQKVAALAVAARTSGGESPRAHRLLNTAVVASWLYAAAFAVWVVRNRSPETRNEQDFLFLPMYLLAGFGAMAGAWQERSSERELLGWRLIGAAWLLSFLAAALWLIPAAIPSATWTDAPAVLFYNAYYPLAATGFVLLSTLPSSRLARFRLVLDVSVVMAACGTISWYFVHDAAPRSTALESILGVGDLTAYGELGLILVASVALHRPAPLGGRVALQVLALGAFAAAVGDLILVRAASPPDETMRAAGNVVLAVAAATFATAGMLRARVVRANPIPTGEILPLVAIATVGGLLVAELGSRRGDAIALAGLASGSMLLTALVVARLTVAQHEARLEAAARSAQQARFLHLVQRSSEALLVVNADGVARYASPATEHMLGIDAVRLTSAPLAGLLPDEEQAALRAALSDPVDGAATSWSVVVDGRRRELESIVTDLRNDPAVDGIVLNTRDVSDRARLEEQLRQTQKLDSLGLLAGGIAHDFNNILAAVRANADYLLYTQPEQSEFELKEIRKATDRGAALCAQLLAFSRSEPGRLEPLNLTDIVDNVLPMLRRVVPRTIELIVRSGGEALHMSGDRVQLEIALLNLVVNARDAMPDGGGITIATGNRVVHPNDGWARDGIPPGAYVTASVHDTGEGMDESTRLRVLEPFFTTKPVGQGTGLGLSTVYGIVTGARGQLRIASHPGAGTTVTMFFPVTSELPASPTPPQSHLALPSNPGRVLVVDDEEMVRVAVARFLESRGFMVAQASDGEEALELLEGMKWKVDAIVTDVTMPRMDGLTLAARVRAKRPALAVVFLTGNAALRDAPSSQAMPGRVDWLLKPFNVEDLLVVLHRRLTPPAYRS